MTTLRNALLTLAAFALTAALASAQPGVFGKDELIKYTPDWEGERFPSGRPKVPDDIIEIMKHVSIE